MLSNWLKSEKNSVVDMGEGLLPLKNTCKKERKKRDEACVCLCVCERERGGKRECVSLCVCVCLCVCERERIVENLFCCKNIQVPNH